VKSCPCVRYSRLAATPLHSHEFSMPSTHRPRRDPLGYCPRDWSGPALESVGSTNRRARQATPHARNDTRAPGLHHSHLATSRRAEQRAVRLARAPSQAQSGAPKH
jgi:hypothetical protein